MWKQGTAFLFGHEQKNWDSSRELYDLFSHNDQNQESIHVNCLEISGVSDCEPIGSLPIDTVPYTAAESFAEEEETELSPLYVYIRTVRESGQHPPWLSW